MIMDKRIIENERVRKSIEEALFLLLEDKIFSKITVSDIIRISGVARASFYRNFESKEEVIESYMSHQRTEIAKMIQFTESVSDIFNEEKLIIALNHYLSQKNTLLLLYDNGFGTFILENMNHFAEISIGDMPQKSIKRYKLYFLSGAMFNTTIQWLKSGAREDPEQMAKSFVNMISDYMYEA